MWLVFLLFILLVGLFLANIEISLNEINLNRENYNFKIVISLKLFGVFKIVSAKLDRFGIRIFNKKVPVSKDKIREFDKESFDLLKDLDLNLKKLKFTLKIGLFDINLTNIAIVIISTIFPFWIRRAKKKNIKYEILPEYNKVCLYFKGKISVSLKLLRLLKFHFKNKKTEITHNKNKIMV